MNFFQVSSERKKDLSQTEKVILEYVLDHLSHVPKMSIRDLASQCFVSTATVFRFVKKLGFTGYSEMIEALEETDEQASKIYVPKELDDLEYRENYMKNIIESVQVMKEEQCDMFCHILGRYPRIFLLADGLSTEIANYAYQILTICGFLVEFPKEDYEVRAVGRRMKRDDVILAFSYSGDNEKVLRSLNDIFTVATPTIISFTKADHNELQSMSDLNFYFFSDVLTVDEMDLTSRCGMLAIFEALIYQTIARNGIH